MRKSEITRITNKVGDQEKSEITRLTRSLLRPTKGSSAPIQKRVPALSLAAGEEKILKEWPVFTSDGERLKVVNLVVAKVVYMKVEMVDKGSKRRRLSWWLLCWGLQEARKKKKKKKNEERKKERGIYRI